MGKPAQSNQFQMPFLIFITGKTVTFIFYFYFA